MNEEQANKSNLLDTTDCLEAVGVFRGWKNFLFAIVILCLLLLQAFFWLVNTGYVKTADESKVETVAASAKDTEQITEAAKQVAAEPNKPAEAALEKPEQQTGRRFGIKLKQLAWFIRFFNFVLILAATLYCLTLLFSLKISLLGRLGGINHISRAFFLSLVMLILVLPWQRFFAGVVSGAIYSPEELLSSCAADESRGTFGTILYYLRFTGYWILVVLLLIFSHLRSSRWTKTILRRLEVI